jgi:putative peptide zinc metalloprotease protein
MPALDLLQEEVSSSQSDLWYRVGPTKPRLAVHANIIRQSLGDRTVFVLEDPASTQYFRLSEAAYWWLGLLDGKRTVHEAWTIAGTQLGEHAPTQRECVELLARLQFFGLLEGDGPVASDMVAQRHAQHAATKRQRRLGMGISLTVPLFNPEPFLEATKALWKAFYSWIGLALWTILVGVALYCVFSKPDALFSQFNRVLDPANLAWMGLILIFLRAWHELGHAAACKALGARTTEVGIMLVMFVFPFPYCDATTAWRLPETRKRIIVSAGGVYFETILAALAAILWWKSEPGLLRTLSYNTMLLSGLTTFVFNLNPLLRYDGYYILADLTGIANLWQRSRDLLTFLIEKYAFGVKALKPPLITTTREFWFVLIYAILSVPYRLLVTFTIVFIIWSNPTYMTLGAVLAVLAAVMFIFLPVGKGFTYLFGSIKLMGQRPRAFAVCAVTLLAIFISVGIIPAPSAGYAPAVIRAQREEPVRVGEAGFVEQIHAHAGARINKGDPLFTLRNPEVTANLALAQASYAEALARLDDAASESPTQRQIEERTVETAEAELTRARQRVAELTVRAPIDGTLTPLGGTPIDLENLPGRFLQRGALVGFITTPDDLLIRAVVSDRDQAYLFPMGEKTPLRTDSSQGVSASFRVRGQAAIAFDAAIVRFPSQGSRTLEAQSLSAQAGGDIVLDPTDQKNETTLDPQFVVDLRPTDPSAAQRLKPGQRAQVRFATPPRPLLVQWWRRLSQSFAERSPV